MSQQTEPFYIYGAYGELLAQYSGTSLQYWNIVAGGESIGRLESDLFHISMRYYYIKDHTSTTLSTGLGSVRVTATANGTVAGYDDYYPFGLQMPGRNWNQGNEFDDQKFTGHFLEQDGNLGIYHAGARLYDPEVPRFYGVDAMRSEMPGWNAYHYSFNNPVRFVDPDGNMPSNLPSLRDITQKAINIAANAAKSIIVNTTARLVNDAKEFVGSAEVELMADANVEIKAGSTAAYHGKGIGIDAEKPTATMLSLNFDINDGLSVNYVNRDGNLTISQGAEAGALGVNMGYSHQFTQKSGEGIVEKSNSGTFSVGIPQVSYGHNFSHTQNSTNETTTSMSTGFMGGGSVGLGWKISGSYNIGMKVRFTTEK